LFVQLNRSQIEPLRIVQRWVPVFIAIHVTVVTANPIASVRRAVSALVAETATVADTMARIVRTAVILRPLRALFQPGELEIERIL
jgi:hypothetical protein